MGATHDVKNSNTRLAMLAAGVTTFALKTTQVVDTTQPPALVTTHLQKLAPDLALP